MKTSFIIISVTFSLQYGAAVVHCDHWAAVNTMISSMFYIIITSPQKAYGRNWEEKEKRAAEEEIIVQLASLSQQEALSDGERCEYKKNTE